MFLYNLLHTVCKKITIIFAVVHYIAAGMTNTPSLEFNICKMRMQLP